MRVVLAGGGTAGHINPAIAIACFIKEKCPDSEILYIGCRGKMEEKLVRDAGFEFKGISIAGFSRKISVKGFLNNLSTLRLIVESMAESKRILEEFKPDICIGTGGYVSGPVLRQAASMGIKIVIHEQNAFPGVTTKLLSKKADRVMLATAAAEKYLDKKCKFSITGNPIRKQILTEEKSEARKQLGLDSRPVILSFGGSLGAQKINDAVMELIKNTVKDDKYQHIHAYGQFDKNFIKNLQSQGIYLNKHPNLDIREYIKNMSTCLAAADLVICRAGAITLSEITAQGKASILIPSPNVAENHQYHNAMEFVNKGAASIIEEKDLTGEMLIQTVQKMLNNKQSLLEYEKNARKMAIVDSTERIYNIVREVVG